MAADVDQQDFVRGDLQGEGDAVTVGQTDGLQTLQLAGEGVQFQTRLEGIGHELAHDFGEARTQVGVAGKELAQAAVEGGSGGKRPIYSASMWRISASTLSWRVTRPAAASSSDSSPCT